LLTAQFTSAFNDNAWKLIVPLLTARGLQAAAPGGDAQLHGHMTLALLVFTLPIILLSLPAGTVVDRVSKRTILIAVKALEILLIVVATLVLVYAPANSRLPLCILGLLGVLNAFFSPAKYGILAEFVGHEQLSWANGLLSLWSFLAIISGTLCGGLLLALPENRLWVGGLLLCALALAGFAAAFKIPRVAAAGRGQSVAQTIQGAWSAIRADRVLRLAIAGAVCYWGLVSLLGQALLVYAKALTNNLPEQGALAGVLDWMPAASRPDALVGLVAALFGLGVGGGSVLAGRWSGGKIEYGLIPLGAVLFSAMSALLACAAPGYVWTWTLAALLGCASGLIVVPLDALVQWRAPANRRGAVIAVENVLVFAAILAGSLVAAGLAKLNLSTSAILGASAVFTLAGTAWALKLLPEALLRLLLVLLTHTLYRLRAVGREHVPVEGGALLVPNHVSFIDGLFIQAALDRPVRFLVDADYFQHPLLRPFMRSLGAIPISSSKGPRTILRALRDASRRLDRGEVVCIFAEGQITRTGMLLPFRRGLERIVRDRQHLIVPTYLDRVWGSIFSREGGRFLTKIPKRIPYPVTVAFGPPLPSGAPLHDIRQAVQELGAESWLANRRHRRTLHAAFVSCCRRHPLKFLYADLQRPRGLQRITALIGAVALARTLREPWSGQRRVGVLLPPSIGAALANAAAALSGRASVNLNYTAGAAGMASAVRQSALETVLTSRHFLDKAALQVPEGTKPLWIEDIAGSITAREKLIAAALALLAPLRILERCCGAPRPVGIDDLATIIFSSGSTAEPKGVMLSHFNVASNVDSASQALRFERDDRMVGILPLFHSFGYVALWFVNNHGMGMAFHPNPIDPQGVGAIVQAYRLTLLVATPTFLQIYLRRCTPAQFGSLRLVVVGAEKLPERLAQAFEDTFGIRPLEGYGTTECSPVVSANVPDFRAPGFYQPGARRGTVGQPLPGIAVRVVDPQTFESLPVSTAGMLLVKGPNVMQGYLDRPDLTAAAMRDGWYITGDIARVDEDNFITITDRLARFSKVGGEMVPHGAVEDALHEAAGVADQSFAVTSVPDARKGEALAVLHTLEPARIEEVLERLNGADLPNLFVPRRDHFIRVDALPLLGTGKLDLKKMKAIAVQELRDQEKPG
jgi:acyl-[acyl-carrier-protein]-phospholipid O-acyltransferase/long-chain-fatty-acid--[acyl-carrier-protein] ligase